MKYQFVLNILCVTKFMTPIYVHETQ